MQSQGAIADMYILTEIVLHLNPQWGNAEYRPVLWLSSTDVFNSHFYLLASLSIHSSGRRCPGSVRASEHDRKPGLAPRWCNLITAPSSTIWRQSR